jgi:hypothetical protein
MFRFRFWEPVWYYELTAKYPAPNFLPRRFVGIAWDHGDAFTYEIWTTPDNVWEDGTKLIRNVVKSRQIEDADPKFDYNDKDLDFTKKETKRGTRTKKNKKRKRQEEQRGVSTTDDAPTDDGINVVADRKKPTVRFASDTPQVIEPEEQGGEKDTGTHSISATTTNTTNKTKNVQDSAHATTNSLKRPREPEETDDEDPGVTLNIDPFEASEPIEMTAEINNHLPNNSNVPEVGRSPHHGNQKTQLGCRATQA